jgi:sulfur carrier protein
MSEITDQGVGIMTVLANGQTYTLQTGSTVADLLQGLNVAPARVVIQLNGNIISRSDFGTTVLHEGHQLEIVTLVGGG